jgi:hypothetical protein
MAIIHRVAMQPSKAELLARWLPNQSWYTGPAAIERVGGFRLDDPAGEVGIEFLIVAGPAFLVPLTYRGTPLPTDDGLIGTAHHEVLGPRWVYHGECDPVMRAQLLALLRGEVVAQQALQSDAVDPTVQVCPLPGALDVAFCRQLTEDPPPADPGWVSATWLRADGSEARGVLAKSCSPAGRK